MRRTLSVSEVRVRFFEVLNKVRRGDTVVVTRYGKPIARMIGVSEEEQKSGEARERLFARLRAEPVVTIPPWKRDELYD
jgi:prevent-host-death family protein